MIRAGICDGKGTRRDVSGVELAKLAEDAKSDSHVLWVDVSDPTDADWDTLADTFRFHPLAIEDARERSERAKMDSYPANDGGTGYLYISVRAWKGGKQLTADLDDVTQEIDLFLGQRYIVTIHEGECPVLNGVRERWEKTAEKSPEARKFPAYLLYEILDATVDECFPAMDELDEQIDDVEAAVYEEGGTLDGRDMKGALRLRKKLLLLRQTVTPLRDLTNELLREDNPDLIPPSLRAYFQDVYDHTLRLVESVDLHRDILTGAMDAMMAQTSNRLNQVMKKMTGISTILMTAALIAGIYGMNVENMWLQHSPHAFEILMAIMVGLSIALAIFFKKINWF